MEPEAAMLDLGSDHFPITSPTYHFPITLVPGQLYSPDYKRQKRLTLSTTYKSKCEINMKPLIPLLK